MTVVAVVPPATGIDNFRGPVGFKGPGRYEGAMLHVALCNVAICNEKFEGFPSGRARLVALCNIIIFPCIMLAG